MINISFSIPMALADKRPFRTELHAVLYIYMHGFDQYNGNYAKFINIIDSIDEKRKFFFILVCVGAGDALHGP